MKTNNDSQATGHNAPTDKKALLLATIPVGILLNLGIGTLVHILKLPLFLDAVGTVLVTILAGIPAGIATGVLSFLLGGLLVNPVMPYFSGTQAAIAVFVGVMARAAFFRSVPRTVLTGILLGVVAAIRTPCVRSLPESSGIETANEFHAHAARRFLASTRVVSLGHRV